MSSGPPSRDIKNIVFPSQRITVGEMVRLEPALFEPTQLLRVAVGDIRAFSTFHWERVLAHKAVAKASGMPDPYPSDGAGELRRLLSESYQAYGLSAGPRHGLELARDIERQAVAVARGTGASRA